MHRLFSLIVRYLTRAAHVTAFAALASAASSAHGFPGQPAGHASYIEDAPETIPHVRGALGVTLGGSSIGGVAIAGVMPNSPAAEAGLRPGDVIFSIDGVAVGASSDVISFVAAHEPDDQVQFAIDRKGLRGTLRATLASPTDVAKRAALGVTLSKSAHGGGVRVLQIVSGSPAAKAGLKIGDRIIAIDDQPVTSYSEVIRLIGESEPGGDLKIGVDRYGLEGTLHASLTGLPQVFSAPRPVARPPIIMPPVPVFELTPAEIDDQRGYSS
jgi:S1-C subfamily serine protease